MGLSRIQSVICRAMPGSLGLPGDQLPSGFQRWILASLLDRSLVPFGSSSFFRFALTPSEYLCYNSRPCSLPFGQLIGQPSRVSALIAASQIRVHTRGASHHPASFRPQVFTTSRRFAPRIGFWAYFIPSHVQGNQVQGLLPSHSDRPKAACPLAVASPSAHRTDLHGPCGPAGSEWLPQRRTSTSRPCSMRGCVPPARWLTEPRVASLFLFRSSRSW